MNLTATTWETAAGYSLVAGMAAVAIWLLIRRRATPEEIERARRRFLAQSGRLVDGVLLDVFEMDAEDGRTLTLLAYNYRIGGVDYECSQDITTILDIVDPARVRIGFPCSVRFQPGTPHNSIVVAEGWNGLRESLPVFPQMEDPTQSRLPRLEAGRG